ncbi:hypothetical protein [Fulvivirga lutimaris]|uniref:hypothetical protein n=1 Tax=Fulvivirga lutimaris TaxID=1819566 RepID=UPI0012BC7E09|nr:hypothetical protein [Fulvivirga lutimaris]MTI40567.1 hypothetical protein [Fulvivirga lutimaris]
MSFLSTKSFLSKVVLTHLLTLFGHFGFSQITQPDRFEVDSEGANFEVISAKNQGAFLVNTVLDIPKKEFSWQVFKLDTAFNLEWNRTYAVPQNQELLGKYYSNGKLYFLFRKNEVKNRNLELISFDQQTGQAESFVIRNYIPFVYFDFKVHNNAAVVGGYYNFRPIVILFNLQEGIPIVLPGLFEDRSELAQISMNKNATFDILLTGRNILKQTTLFLYTYNYEGVLVKKTDLKPEHKKELLFGRSKTLPDGKQIIAGVYGRSISTDYSRGVFMADVEREDEQSISYYNYADLKNFFNYMRAKREKRVLERIERRKIKQKRLRFNYRLLVHDLIPQGDHYILLGEAFYPKYKNVSGTYYGSGTIMWTTNNGILKNSRVFEGFKYTHAVVLGFDKEGKLLWDNSFEINDVLSQRLEQYVHASVSEDKIALLYVYEDFIRSKIISEDQVLEGKELTPVALKNKNDVVREGGTELMGIESWYNNVFYVYGTQKIQNPGVDNIPLQREVFFINKVIYK